MNIELDPGQYVVAVSGGVDSVVLLRLLAERISDLRFQSIDDAGQPKIQDPRSVVRLTVAHFDHGIRADSAKDRQFVEELAKQYGLPFVYGEGKLGKTASEAAARRARYNFLHRVKEASDARAIITAHHQDDLLETAIINIVRGTGRRGLTALQGADTVIRPLLHVPKQELLDYARKHNLKWREDPSNQDINYLRNYVRHKILSRFSPADRQKLLGIIEHLHTINRQIDEELPHIIKCSTSHMERQAFIMLPHGVAREALAYWLRQADIRGYDRKTLERLAVAAKVYRPGRVTDINKDWQLAVSQHDIVLQPRSS